MTTLFRLHRAGVGADEALATLLAVSGADRIGVTVCAATEREYVVTTAARLAAGGLGDTYDVECFTGDWAMRWTATSQQRPFTGTARVLGETAPLVDRSDAGWIAETLSLDALPGTYACWGDVIERNDDGRVLVGDDARIVTMLGCAPPCRPGDRLDLAVVEYVGVDGWGNHAVVCERPVGFQVAGRRS